MANITKKYFKSFRGTNLNVIDPHSPPTISEEDEKIRRNIIDKFSGNITYTKSGKETHHGFDGSQNYYFKFYEENWNEEEKSKPSYNLLIEISKTGNKTLIERFPCDLERFITASDNKLGFQRQD